jgi:hypothetical protein
VRALEHHGAPIRALAATILPPIRDRNAWKVGKTDHTIAFVDEAEQALRTSAVSPSVIADLRDAINALTRGETSLDEPQSINDWLTKLHNR